MQDEVSDDEDDLDWISKSQRKRDMQALRDLGKQLVELKPAQLATMPLPHKLAVEIDDARKIKSHLALKRQLQYIGKVLRSVEVEPIEKALADLFEAKQREVDQFHVLEQYRDRLISEGDDALHEVLNAYPHCDRQYLRQLVRNAKKTKQTKYARQIFRYLAELYEQKEIK